MGPGGPASIRRRRLEPLSQRLRRALLRLTGGAAKAQRVYRVEIGELRLKQILFSEAGTAERLEGVLERFREARIVPRVVARFGSELWLEFVEGDALRAGDPAPIDELVRIFATLYRADPRPVGAAERDFPLEIERDLRFLRAVGILDANLHEALRRRAHQAFPGEVWVGCDYSDSRPQNFLRVEGGELRLIDVESLQDDQLLGAGAVRAALRWPGLSRDRLFTRLGDLGAAPFLGYVDFVELWYLCSWTKRCVLQRKRRLVDVEALARLAAGA